VNPRRLPRRHFLQHPKADHFLQPRGEQRFRQAQRRLDFSISAKLEETPDSVSAGSNGRRSPTMLCTVTRIARPKCSTSSALSPRRFPLVGTGRLPPHYPLPCFGTSVLNLFILRPPSGGTPGRTATSLLTRQIILCVRCQLYSKFRTRPARMTRPNCARR
jgi:hypothetical protein